MARFKRFRRGAGKRNNFSLDNAAKGVGYSVVAKRFLGNNDLIALGAAYYGGGFAGVVGSMVVGTASLGSLGGLLGGIMGGNSNQSGGNANSPTFY